MPGGGVDQSDLASGGTWTAEAVPAGAGMTWGVIGAGVNPMTCASATLVYGDHGQGAAKTHELLSLVACELRTM